MLLGIIMQDGPENLFGNFNLYLTGLVFKL
jgi:hypothetical protein